MQCNLITYTARPEHREDNAAKVREVFKELESTAPAGFGYLVLATDSGEFVHITFSADGDSTSLTTLQAFREFQSDHARRRSGEVARSSCSVVGAYGLPRSWK
jgi:hypothetical protein